jgi:hypothetical protein
VSLWQQKAFPLRLKDTKLALRISPQNPLSCIYFIIIVIYVKINIPESMMITEGVNFNFYTD